MFENDFTYTTPPPFVIEVDPPLQTAKGAIDELRLREPLAGEVFQAEAHLAQTNARSQRLYQRALLSRITGVADDAIGDLPVSIFSKAASYLQGFVESGLPVAEQSPETLPPSFTINFDPPLPVGENATIQMLRLHEPTINTMQKAETALGDLSAQRVRLFQQNIVAACCGENPGKMAMLPISVLNRAAAYLMFFTTAGQATSKSP